MPNGHQEDTRPLWERVRDTERTLSHVRTENKELREVNEKLLEENKSLLTTISLVKKAES